MLATPERTETQPERLGPYRILGVLGRGGMGVVYRARHERNGELAAIKSLHLPKQTSLSGLRREIHALSRLQHPGIVQILDQGLDHGVPWYAMDLVEGWTLRRWARLGTSSSTTADFDDPSGRLWTESLADIDGGGNPAPALAVDSTASGTATDTAPRQAPISAVLEVMRRLCVPLAYLHGEGIVHRDLKPENVLMLPAPGQPVGSLSNGAHGRPVLVDFGLTVRFSGALSREALDVVASAGGTVPYMAPEQLRGESLDARADLYALGCLLYELLTGRPPFTGANPAQIVQQHLLADPRPPSELVDGLPDGLDELLMRLLAKEPRQRLAYATDVARVLMRFGASDETPVEGPPARLYLIRPGLAGRKEELRKLDRSLRRLRAGEGGVLLVGGESGVGKTRLMLEAVREAARREMQVLVGQSRPGATAEAGGAAPLEPLRPVLQGIADRCRENGFEETERLLGRRGKVLEPYEPALRHLPGQDAYPELAPLPPEASRLRFFGALAETLVELARGRSLLVVLDDLQWADELTLDFLGFLARAGSKDVRRAFPALVLGTYRTEEVGPRLSALLEQPGLGRVVLRRLPEDAVGCIVMDMLGLDTAPVRFVHFLTRQSEGNPFFVAEYLRTAVAQGLLYRDAEGFWQVVDAGDHPSGESVYESLPLPSSLRELVTRHLEGIDGEARELLEAASVLGREWDIGLLGLMKGLEGPRLLDGITELLRRQVLEEPAPGRLRFLHDKLREVEYAAVGLQRRASLHRAAAVALENQAPEKRERANAVLAHHWDQAGEAERARSLYLVAAREAVSAHALTEAERLYRAHLRLAERPTVESTNARIELTTGVLEPQGRMEDMLAECERTLGDARTLHDEGLEAIILRAAARAHRNQSRPDEARKLLLRSLDIWRKFGDRQQEGNTLGSLGVLDVEKGLMEQGRACYEEAIAIAREIGDPVREARWLSNLSGLELTVDDIDTASTLLERALQITPEKGDRGNMLANLAILYKNQGRMEEARRAFEEALEIDRAVGNRLFEGIALGNLADLVRLTTEDLELAERLGREADEIFADIGDQRLSANFMCVVHGSIALARGQSAAEPLRHAEAVAREIGSGPESELEQAIVKLRAAQAAFESGEHHRLFRGELIEMMADGVRQWVARTHPPA